MFIIENGAYIHEFNATRRHYDTIANEQELCYRMEFSALTKPFLLNLVNMCGPGTVCAATHITLKFKLYERDFV